MRDGVFGVAVVAALYTFANTGASPATAVEVFVKPRE